MLTLQHCKESLSRAYITAVVGRSRNNILWGREFDYGVDGSVRLVEKRGERIRETFHGFDFQAKSTVDWAIEGDEILYDLDADAYNDLAERAECTAHPFLLLLLCLPKGETEWLNVTGDNLILKNCAYWLRVRDALTANKESRRIRVPNGNIFSPDAVSGLLTKIKAGVMLP